MRMTMISKLLGCTAVMALLFGVSSALPAFGSQLVMESFTHPDGALEGQTPEVGGAWAPHSGDGTNDVQVVSGQAKLNQPGSGEDIHSNFVGGPIGAGDTVYAAFDLTVPSQSAAVGDVYFAHFKDSGNFFGSRIWMTAPTTSGYRLALSGDSSITDGDGEAYWGSDLAFDTTYRVVSSYSYDTGVGSLWINPVSESSTSVTATDGFDSDAFENYSFRQSTSTSMQLIDNLCVATTFDEALNCVPEPAALALLSLAALAFAGVTRRR